MFIRSKYTSCIWSTCHVQVKKLGRALDPMPDTALDPMPDTALDPMPDTE